MAIAPACSSLLLVVACHLLHPAASAAGSSVFLEGTVREGGQPLEGAWLFFLPEGASLFAWSNDALFATSDCDGCYAVRDLAPGRWRVLTIMPGADRDASLWMLMGPMGSMPASDVSLWKQVLLTIPDVPEFKHDLDWPISDLTGRVSGEDPEGVLAQVPISFDPEGGWKEGTLLPQQRIRLVTDAEGRFRVRGLPPGRYLVRAGGPGEEGVAPNMRRSEPKTVDVAEGSVAEVVFALTEAGERLSGQVLDARGLPKGRAAVHVFGDGGVEVTRVAADHNGAFAVVGLDAGTYTVVVDYCGQRSNSGHPGPTFIEGVIVCGGETRPDLRSRDNVRLEVVVQWTAECSVASGNSVSILSPAGVDLSPFVSSEVGGVIASYSEVELDEEGNAIQPTEPPAPVFPKPERVSRTYRVEPDRYTIVARVGDREERRSVLVTDDGAEVKFDFRD